MSFLFFSNSPTSSSSHDASLSRLTQLVDSVLDDSHDVVDQTVLMELIECACRTTIMALSKAQAETWEPALQYWEQYRRHGSLNITLSLEHALLNHVYDTPGLLPSDRVHDLKERTEEVFDILFQLEETLVDLARVRFNTDSLNERIKSGSMQGRPSVAVPRNSSLLMSSTTRSSTWVKVCVAAMIHVNCAVAIMTSSIPSNGGCAWPDRPPPLLLASSSDDDGGGNGSDILSSINVRKWCVKLISQLQQPSVTSMGWLFQHSTQSKSTHHHLVHVPFSHRAIVRLGGTLSLLVTGGVMVHVALQRTSMDFTRTFLTSASSWFRAHLLDPARAMFDELFLARVPRAGNRHVLEDAKTSLHRMVDTWFQEQDGINNKIGNDSRLLHMSQAYEQAIMRPIRHVMSGDLLRLALIQVQLLKSEMLALAASLDDVLVENHFNSQILATLPAAYVLNVIKNRVVMVWSWFKDESTNRDAAIGELVENLWEIEFLLLKEKDSGSVISPLSGFEEDLASEVETGIATRHGGGGGDDAGSARADGAMSPVYIRPVDTDTTPSYNQLGNGHVTNSSSTTTGPISPDQRFIQRHRRPSDICSRGESENDDRRPGDEHVVNTSGTDGHHRLKGVVASAAQVYFDPNMLSRRRDAGRLVYLVCRLWNVLARTRNVLFSGKRAYAYALARRDVSVLFPREMWTASTRVALVRSFRAFLYTLGR